MQPAPKPRRVACFCLSPRSSSSLSSVTFMLTRSFCTVCIAGAAKSSSLRHVARSRGPPARRRRASRSAAPIAELPACAPLASVATARRPRLVSGTSTSGWRHRAAERRVLGAHAKRGAAARAACRSAYAARARARSRRVSDSAPSSSSSEPRC